MDCCSQMVRGALLQASQRQVRYSIKYTEIKDTLAEQAYPAKWTLTSSCTPDVHENLSKVIETVSQRHSQLAATDEVRWDEHLLIKLWENVVLMP